MTILGKLVVTFLIPLFMALFTLVYAHEVRKKRLKWWSLRIFWGNAALEIFFTLLAIWGVR